ncbi:MAG: DUF4249 domain-containing protein [Sphingobacteriales bacterium]|nr:MAG: DUF4249 domain-containing protein [Sphingobacteriales bacterium]
MNKIVRSYMPLVAAVALLSSCEKTIKVNTPPHTSALVINSSTMTGETISVAVGRSAGVTSYKTSADLNINSATVVLSEDGVPVQALTYDPVSSMYNSALVAKPGKTYSIKASFAGYTDAEATTLAPGTVKIEEMRVTPNARATSNERQDELSITFTDPSAAGDYYMVTIHSLPPQGPDSNNMQYSYSECVYSPDPSIESISSDEIDQNTCHSSEGLFFRDELFNGKRKELKLYVREGFSRAFSVIDNDTLRPTITLYHMSEAYFRYMKTAQASRQNEGNPFAEPVSVYSNIKNGYGIFSVVSSDEKEIK